RAGRWRRRGPRARPRHPEELLVGAGEQVADDAAGETGELRAVGVLPEVVRVARLGGLVGGQPARPRRPASPPAEVIAAEAQPGVEHRREPLRLVDDGEPRLSARRLVADTFL